MTPFFFAYNSLFANLRLQTRNHARPPFRGAQTLCAVHAHYTERPAAPLTIFISLFLYIQHCEFATSNSRHEHALFTHWLIALSALFYTLTHCSHILIILSVLTKSNKGRAASFTIFTFWLHSHCIWRSFFSDGLYFDDGLRPTFIASLMRRSANSYIFELVLVSAIFALLMPLLHSLCAGSPTNVIWFVLFDWSFFVLQTICFRYFLFSPFFVFGLILFLFVRVLHRPCSVQSQDSKAGTTGAFMTRLWLASNNQPRRL